MLLIDEKSIEYDSSLVIKNLGQIYKYMPPLIIGTPQLSTLYFDLSQACKQPSSKHYLLYQPKTSPKTKVSAGVLPIQTTLSKSTSILATTTTSIDLSLLSQKSNQKMLHL